MLNKKIPLNEKTRNLINKSQDQLIIEMIQKMDLKEKIENKLTNKRVNKKEETSKKNKI